MISLDSTPQNSVQYKCPNCSGDLKFDAATQGFACEYCDSLFTKEEMDVIAAKQEVRKKETEADRAEFEAHTNLYSCPSCGAEIIAEETTAASFCYYCHNPVILQGRLSGEYRPSKVLPFQITAEQAKDIFRNWCKQRWFVPKAFRSKQQLERLTGLYVPFWVADCDVSADMHAIGKQIRSWTSGNYRYTETKEFAVHRAADINFAGLPADGSSKIENELMEAIEPFNYEKAQPFDMTYLSGFLADKYDVPKANVFPRIRNRAVQGSDQLLRSTMQYSAVSVTSSAINVLRTDFEYMLLPVWFMTYQHEGKTYEFVINGQSGKLAGTPPLDKKRLRLFCVGLAAAIGLIFTLGGGLFTWLQYF